MAIIANSFEYQEYIPPAYREQEDPFIVAIRPLPNTTLNIIQDFRTSTNYKTHEVHNMDYTTYIKLLVTYGLVDWYNMLDLEGNQVELETDELGQPTEQMINYMAEKDIESIAGAILSISNAYGDS